MDRSQSNSHFASLPTNHRGQSFEKAKYQMLYTKSFKWFDLSSIELVTVTSMPAASMLSLQRVWFSKCEQVSRQKKKRMRGNG
jgi:hypothetical protein